ncbi:MAG: hypothetical protein ACE5JU_20600 [Candidatus Binatia bacterium]
MAGKPKILRDLEGLPGDALKEVQQFIACLKKYRGGKQIAGRNGKVLAKKQLSAIKQWAGRNLGAGFAGREHDAVLYEGKR